MQPLRQSILDMEAIMSVADIYEKRATFSFEVFPPKTDVGMEKLCGKDGVLDKLYTLQPDYISCTYGAGGTNVGKNLEVLDKIQKDGKTIPVTHFTCIGNTKEDIKEKLQTYLDHGIDHMLALRGDLPFGWTGTNGDLHYATELVKFVRKEFGDKFTIAVAMGMAFRTIPINFRENMNVSINQHDFSPFLCQECHCILSVPNHSGLAL